MSKGQSLTYKMASTDRELEQIFRLNYQTFVKEIPQHQPNKEGRLVDRFHNENTYLIALQNRRLVGMMAVRGGRPFSLDEKLGSIDRYLPKGRCPCEIRLLSVTPDHRRGPVLRGLLRLLLYYGKSQGYSLAVISGTVRQLKLYEHLGFQPFGPRVGTSQAEYQPMFLTLEDFEEHAGEVLNPTSRLSWESEEPLSFLPGPVNLAKAVRDAFNCPPISHRSAAFRSLLGEVKHKLTELVNSQEVAVLVGSGTLANDAIAGQLSLETKPGLIWSNGEFGERLIDHATRFQLSFDSRCTEWGDPFDWEAIDRYLDNHPQVGWLWATACETSTGLLNDPERLKQLCRQRNLKLCLDAISAIGNVPIDLSQVFLASGVSGKGLGSFSGLSLVFYQHPVQPQPARLARYLDLGFHAQQAGIPFTQNSNLLRALGSALDQFDTRTAFEKKEHQSLWLREQLQDLGFQTLFEHRLSVPAVITLKPPAGVHALALGAVLEKSGFLVSHESTYLQSRGWIQICLMGEQTDENLMKLVARLRQSA